MSGSAFGYLFEDMQWGTVSARFERLITPPGSALINHVNLVPYVQVEDERLWVVVLLSDGRHEVPGGTREADEIWHETARRELFEEAGAELVSFTPFGAWRCHSASDAPWKPHLAHPDFCRLVGVGEVRLVTAPDNPPDGEDVAAVLALPLDDAAQAFAGGGRPDLAVLYRMAAWVAAEGGSE